MFARIGWFLKIDWLNKYETSHNKFCFFHFNKCWCTYLVLSDIPGADTPKRDFWTAVIEHSNIVSFNFKHATMSDRTISHISIEIIQRKWHEEIIRQVDSAWPFPDLVAGYLSIVQSDLKRSSCCCCKINYQRKGWKKTYKLYILLMLKDPGLWVTKLLSKQNRTDIFGRLFL